MLAKERDNVQKVAPFPSAFSRAETISKISLKPGCRSADGPAGAGEATTHWSSLVQATALHESGELGVSCKGTEW